MNGADIGLGFAGNWMFVPGYREGQAPYGSWTATELMTTDGWQSGANLRLDVGAAMLARDSQGRGIQDVLGARGIAFHQPRNQMFDAYGYPAIDRNTSCCRRTSPASTCSAAARLSRPTIVRRDRGRGR